MSSREPCDTTARSTIPSGAGVVNYISVEPHNVSEFLSDLSPKHKPWDQHRGETDDVAHVYAASPFSRHRRYAERMRGCSQYIGFARDPPTKDGKQKLKFKTGKFCRCRFCATCMWRRSLMWQARIHRALPKLIADFPQARFLFVTFTLKNCDPNLLRLTLKLMQQAWKRLILLKAFPAIGWMRSMEVTRGRDGNAHPHFHTLLMVQPEYFKAGYLKQSEWAEMWRKCLRIDYKPVVHIVAVDPQHEPWRRSEVTTEHAVWNAATEVMKYFMKVSDMLSDDKWMLTVSDEVWKMRAVALGGVFKTYLKDRRREDLRDEPEADLLAAEPQQIYFNWKQLVRRYKKFA